MAYEQKEGYVELVNGDMFFELTPEQLLVIQHIINHPSGEDYAGDWGEVIDDLLRFRLYEDNWDGEGSDAPNPKVIDDAIRVAQEFKTAGDRAPSAIMLGMNGVIYFEWANSIGFFKLEIRERKVPICRQPEQMPTL